MNPSIVSLTIRITPTEPRADGSLRPHWLSIDRLTPDETKTIAELLGGALVARRSRVVQATKPIDWLTDSFHGERRQSNGSPEDDLIADIPALAAVAADARGITDEDARLFLETYLELFAPRWVYAFADGDPSAFWEVVSAFCMDDEG